LISQHSLELAKTSFFLSIPTPQKAIYAVIKRASDDYSPLYFV